MSEKVAGRSQTPSRVRPSFESNGEKSQESGINVAAQGQLWHNSLSFGLWDNLNTWKILIYSLIAWGLYEMYWTGFKATLNSGNFWPSVNTGFYRFTILAVFTTFFIQFKDEVVGAGNTIRSWFSGFEASNPFLSTVVEASVTVSLSTAFYQWWTGAGKLRVDTLYHLIGNWLCV